MRLLLVLVGLCALLCGGEAAAPRKKVLIVGIDGFRAEALLALELPNLRRLMADGCWTVEAHTGPITVSGPGWSSLLCGVWMEKHGVRDNEFQGAHFDRYPHFFARLKEARPDLKTASFVDWLPLDEVVLGAVGADVRFSHPYQDAGDDKVVAAAVDTLAHADPDCTFVYFADLDEAGHANGFDVSVPEYAAALRKIDGQIGELLTAIERRSRRAGEDWLVIVGADHGGTIDGNHGRDISEHRRIPLIVSGPSAASGRLWATANQVDIPVTALTHLGVKLDPLWGFDGRPIGLARPTPLGQNLIWNGDAERSTGFPDTATNVGIAGWTDTGPMTVVLYGAPDGFPSADCKGPPARGRNFFCGGKAGESSIEQVLDVADQAAAVDGAGLVYALSGWFGGFSDQRDQAWLELTFLDERGGELGRTALAPVTLADRRKSLGGEGTALTGFVERRISGPVPKFTRRIRVVLHAEAGEGDCDGYADDLALVLQEPR